MFPRRFSILIVFLALLSVSLAADPAGRPVLLYSRYFNAIGEARYQPDGSYRDILAKLGEKFEVRVNALPLDQPGTLEGVALVIVANPSDKAVNNGPAPHHCTAADVAALRHFVEGGGGLLVMGNQENHNLETADFNALLAAFGMRWEPLYTDAKKLVIPAGTPAIGGLRWAYYTGNLLVLDPAHPAKPRSLVSNDLSQKPVGGPRDQAGVLMAAAEAGRGRFVAVTDAGWISNDVLRGKGIGGVVIPDNDNLEIFLRLAAWAAGGH